MPSSSQDDTATVPNTNEPPPDDTMHSPHQESLQIRLSDRTLALIFTVLGIGSILPWNAFISAKPYFEARLCEEDGTSKVQNIELFFGFLYTAAAVLSLGGLIWYQWQKEGEDGMRSDDQSDRDNGPFSFLRCFRGKSTDWLMVQIPLSIYLTMFVLLAAAVFFPSFPVTAFLFSILASVFVSGILQAFQSSGIVTTANSFSAHIGLGPYFSGQAMGGVVVSGINFLAAVIGDDSNAFWNEKCSMREVSVFETFVDGAPATCVPYDNVDWASFGYFGIACVTLAACIFGYNFLDGYNHSSYTEITDEVLEQEEDGGDSPRLVSDFPSREERIKYSAPYESDETDSDAEVAEEVSNVLDHHDAHTIAPTTGAVLRIVRGPAASLILVFFVTLGIFPGFSSTLKSAHQCESRWRLSNDLYVPATFVVYNVFDTVGRVMADRWMYTGDKFVLLSLLRFVFFGLFLLCPADRTSFPSLVIHSDIVSLLIQAAFGISNGFLVSSCFLKASKLIPSTSPHQVQERSSEIMNFSLSFGLLAGSTLSFAYNSFATGKWR